MIKNTIRSFIVGSVLTVSRFHNFKPLAARTELVTSHRSALLNAKADKHSKMTVKQLKKVLTEKKVKGRSKLVRRSDILKALASL